MNDAILNSLWAKIGRTSTDSYACRHPLACHLVDVGTVTWLLWEEVLRDGFKSRIARALTVSIEDAGRWLAFWAAAHDIGKASPGFQAKRRDAKMALEGRPFEFSHYCDNPHATVTTAVLEALLQQPRKSWPCHERELA